MGGVEAVDAGDDRGAVRLEILLDLMGDGGHAIAGRAGLERPDVVEVDPVHLAAGEVAGIGEQPTKTRAWPWPTWISASWLRLPITRCSRRDSDPEAGGPGAAR